MNMENVIRFKTMIGYCYLYPDKIIMARNGNPEEVNLKNEEQRLWKHLVFYTITGLLLTWLAYKDRDHLPMCLWLGLTSAWLLSVFEPRRRSLTSIRKYNETEGKESGTD